MVTDRVVYETTDRPVYVIQFEEAPGEWRSSGDPQFRHLDAAINWLNKKLDAPYAFRIVERTK